jgi:hypothetical protein
LIELRLSLHDCSKLDKLSDVVTQVVKRLGGSPETMNLVTIVAYVQIPELSGNIDSEIRALTQELQEKVTIIVNF